MTTKIDSKLISILTSLRARPRRKDGGAYTDADIAALPLEQVDIDSLTFLEVMYWVEEEFGIVLGDVSVDEFRTLGDVAAHVASLQKTG